MKYDRDTAMHSAWGFVFAPPTFSNRLANPFSNVWTL